MADPTPWQLARPTQATIKKRALFARDLYNFSGFSVSQGTNNPVVPIPSMGPAAAGAVTPQMWPQVIGEVITITGSVGPEYGANFTCRA